MSLKYHIVRTDTADAGIRKIILYVAQNFGNDVALEKLDEIEKSILRLEDDPYLGTDPRYPVLKRQGYKVLILAKDLVFYKVNEANREVIIYAVVDQRQDYLNIIRGL
jgi:toxin ParE1/3/4